MATRTINTAARQLHLTRAAQVAGEAFGFEDRDAASIRSGRGGLLWLGSMTSALIGLVAAAALYTGI